MVEIKPGQGKKKHPHPDCAGCIYRIKPEAEKATHYECTRFPPQPIQFEQVVMPNVALLKPGVPQQPERIHQVRWMFPAAFIRCGEYREAPSSRVEKLFGPNDAVNKAAADEPDDAA